MKDSIVYTIGHSTKTFEQFVKMIKDFGVESIVDIRTVPRSRTNPKYNIDTLPNLLTECGVSHYRIAQLGGLRKKSNTVPVEVNSFWENRSFHNYADYALSAQFEIGLNQLLVICETKCCAIMCAEAVWWRCHRRIVADYLLTRDVEVAHIMGQNKMNKAVLNPAAVIREGKLNYPASVHQD